MQIESSTNMLKDIESHSCLLHVVFKPQGFRLPLAKPQVVFSRGIGSGWALASITVLAVSQAPSEKKKKNDRSQQQILSQMIG